MKKIIITGGLGYIGTELCKIYSGQSRTKNIVVIDNKFHSSRVEQLKRWGIKYTRLSGTKYIGSQVKTWCHLIKD